MSYNAGTLPTPVTESTAVVVRRIEGSVRSYVALATINAGNIVYLTNSGALQTTGAQDPNSIVGIALYQALSGARVVVAKGQLRAYWDGLGTVTPGIEVNLSYTYSGWFSQSGSVYSVLSGLGSIGFYAPQAGYGTLTSANSGTLVPIEIR